MSGDLLWPAVVDDDFFYYTTKSPHGSYSSDFDWTVMRVPKTGGTPEALVTSTSPLAMMAVDSAASYIYEFSDVDENNQVWGGSIMRLPFGGSTLGKFADNVNVNDWPGMLVQNGSVMWVSQYFYESDTDWLQRFTKPGSTGYPSWQTQLHGAVRGAYISGNDMRYVLEPYPGTPTAWRVPVNGSGPVQLGQLPDQCSQFVGDPAHSAWIAICGSSSYDLVRITESGGTESLRSGLSSGWVENMQVRGAKAYWVDGSTIQGTDTIVAVDLETHDSTTLRLEDGASFVGLDDGYVYYLRDSGQSSIQVRRTPLP